MRNKAINSLFSLVLWLLLAAPAIAQDGSDTVDYLALASLMLRDGNIDRAIKLCDASDYPVLQLVKSGLTHANRDP